VGFPAKPLIFLMVSQCQKVSVKRLGHKKRGCNNMQPLFLGILAPQPGLEPGTYGLTVRRSTN